MARADWTETQLGQVVTFQRGYDITKAVQRDGPFPVISSSGPSSRHAHYKASGPGVVIGRKGSLGGVYFSPGPYWPHDTTLWVRDFHGNDPRFIYYLLRTMHLEQYDVGASNPTLNRNHLHLLRVRVPPIDVQRKIASVLSAYDDLIENNRHRIELLDEMAQRAYREWFVDFRYPGHQDVPLVESLLGPVPEGWEIKTLGDVCARITDGAHASPPTTDQGLPMASVKDMGDFSLDIASCRRISVSDFQALQRQGCKPTSGDVLLSKDGAKYLEKVFPLFEDVNVVLLSSIAILRTGDSVTPTVLTLMARDPQTRTRMKALVSGAAIPRVVLRDLKSFPIALAPSTVQRRFDDLAGPMLRLVIKLEDANRKLKTTRDLLLAPLVSGQIDIDDLETFTVEAAA